MGNQPAYIAHSRPSRRAHRGMIRIAAILHIEIEPRWTEFGHFLADLGHRPEGTTLVRIDERQGFFPNNCAWTTLPIVPEPIA